MTQVPYTFGNESSPIPLSQLDANFAAPIAYANTAGNVANAAQPNITSVGPLTALSVTGNTTSGNFQTAGAVSAAGNISVGNVLTGGIVSATGSIHGGTLTSAGNITGGDAFTSVGNATVGNLLTVGVVSATGDINGANVNAAGYINAVGDITTIGNVLTESTVSATGNIYTASYFVGNFRGNIVGNSVAVVGSNTQILFNTNGDIDAVAGLTYNKGSNVLSVLGQISARSDIISTAGNLSINGRATIGSNLTVGGAVQITGTATGLTPATASTDNQLATTAFVNNRINQYATGVNITGGSISGISSLGVTGGISGSSLNVPNGVTISNWRVYLSGTSLIFQYNNAPVAKLDSSGHFTAVGDVTGFGSV